MLKRKFFFATGIFLSLFTLAFADIIVLKSGETIEADIVERDTQKVVVDLDGIKLPYFLSDIAKINDEEVGTVNRELPVAQESLPLPEDQDILETQPIEQPRAEILPPEVLPSRIVAEEAARPVLKPGITGKSSRETSPTTLLIILIFAVAAYIYGATCLQMIAKKTNQGPDWHAWVPIMNLMLLCRVAAVPYIWLLLFFAALIPFVGPLCGAGFSAFIWYKVAVVLKKPSWIGFLAAIPLVNFIVMGYFAFSNNN